MKTCTRKKLYKKCLRKFRIQLPSFSVLSNQACLNAGGNIQHLLEHVVSHIIYITRTNVRTLYIPCVWVHFLIELSV